YHAVNLQPGGVLVADVDGSGLPDLLLGTTPPKVLLNRGEADQDHDGIKNDQDPCTDVDGDGFGNPGFPANTCPDDNCPGRANADQADAAGDGVGNACDVCPNRPDSGQADTDADGTGDACDTCTDRDHDGLGDPGF